MNTSINAVGFDLSEDQQSLIEKKLDRVKYADDLIVDLAFKVKEDKKSAKKEEAKPVIAPRPKAAPASSAPAGGVTVASPLPGVILEISVKEGDAVQKGQKIMVLEAMKMENEIMAGCDGTVTSVAVTKGQSVETGALLAIIG